MSRTVELRDADRLEVTTRSGRLTVIAEPGRANIEIDGLLDRSRRRQVWREGKRLHVRAGRGSNAVSIRCPMGSNVNASSDSGRLELRGDLGDVRAQTQSGHILIEQARSVDARTKDGRLEIFNVHGQVKVGTTSGKVEIERAHNAKVASVSGHLELNDVQGAVDAASVSGSVQISTHGAGNIFVGTVSGRVEIRVPNGRRPSVSAKRKSGSLKVECEEGDDLKIRIATVSGSVTVGNHSVRAAT